MEFLLLWMMKWKTGRDRCEFSKAHITSLKDGNNKDLLPIGYKPKFAGDIPKNIVN